MSRSRDFGNIASSASSTLSAGKNFIINGGMDIWQRATTSGTVTGASKRFTLDRFWHSGGSANISYTASRQASDLTGFQYFIRLQRTATTTGPEPIYFAQDLETANSIFLAGKTVTFSFYARKGADYSAGDIRLQIRSGTGTDESTYSGFTNSTNIINGSQFSPTALWARYQVSVTVPTNSTQLGVFLYFYPSGTAGTNDYIDITGIQLEVGSVATSFSRAGGNIQGELALCQRYYYRTYSETAGGWLIPSMQWYSSTQAQGSTPHPVTMRAIPLVNYGGSPCLVQSNGNRGSVISSFSNNSSTTKMLGAQVVTTAYGTAGYVTGLMGSGTSTTDYIEASAEL